jgi:hypothetical protein
LHNQVDPPVFELLVVADRDPAIAQQVLDAFPEAHVQMASGQLPGAARNLLIAQARGELLLFLDDDVVAEPDLLHNAYSASVQHPDVGVFGGPNLTPPGSSTFQFVQGAVLGSILAAGPVRKRYGVHHAGPTSETSLTLCNLVVRRQSAVPFARDLVCAEENEAMRRLRRNGVTMRSDPDLVVFHERRQSGGPFASQMFKYGRGRGQLLQRDPRALRVAHVVPTLLCLYVLTLPLLLALWSSLWLIPIAAYAIAICVSSLWIDHCTGRVRPFGQFMFRFVLAAALIVVVHAAYGVGLLRGLLDRRRIEQEAPQMAMSGLATEPPFS